MSDDEVVASYGPPRSLLWEGLSVRPSVCPSGRRSHTSWIFQKSDILTTMKQKSFKRKWNLIDKLDWQFKGKYASRSLESIWCLNSVRLAPLYQQRVCSHGELFLDIRRAIYLVTNSVNSNCVCSGRRNDKSQASRTASSWNSLSSWRNSVHQKWLLCHHSVFYSVLGLHFPVWGYFDLIQFLIFCSRWCFVCFRS